jgi:hypothetical protein
METSKNRLILLYRKISSDLSCGTLMEAIVGEFGRRLNVLMSDEWFLELLAEDHALTYRLMKGLVDARETQGTRGERSPATARPPHKASCQST